MDAEIRKALVAASLEARSAAYAPYSEFFVGASLLTASGKIVSGCNVENASYGLCFCAERTAIVKAVSQGEQEFVAFAVATEAGGTPCGACRQFIAEFCGGETLVIVHDTTTGEEVDYRLDELLPHAFRF